MRSAALARGYGADKVVVACRVRPFLDRDSDVTPYLDIRESESTVSFLSKRGQNHVYNFDRVFGPGSGQEDVFRSLVLPILRSVVSGRNGCVMAYGASFSGKTYSIAGPSYYGSSRGIIPRALSALFQYFESWRDSKGADGAREAPGEPGAPASPVPPGPRRRDSSAELSPPAEGHGELVDFSVSISFVEIYLETLKDLFAEETSPVSVPSTPSRAYRMAFDSSRSSARERRASEGTRPLVITSTPEGMEVKNLTVHQISSAAQAADLITRASALKVVADNRINPESSRSHCILTVHVSQVVRRPGGAAENLRSRLDIVDLAGSESITRTEAAGVRFRETSNINRSLLALGRIIHILADNSQAALAAERAGVAPPVPKFIPYRESKLTRLLEDSLGASGRAAVLVHLSPDSAYVNETKSTLVFAQRAAKIYNVARVNVDLSSADQQSAKQLLAFYRARLDSAEGTISALRELVVLLGSHIVYGAPGIRSTPAGRASGQRAGQFPEQGLAQDLITGIVPPALEPLARLAFTETLDDGAFVQKCDDLQLGRRAGGRNAGGSPAGERGPMPGGRLGDGTATASSLSPSARRRSVLGASDQIRSLPIPGGQRGAEDLEDRGGAESPGGNETSGSVTPTELESAGRGRPGGTFPWALPGPRYGGPWGKGLTGSMGPLGRSGGRRRAIEHSSNVYADTTPSFTDSSGTEESEGSEESGEGDENDIGWLGGARPAGRGIARDSAPGDLSTYLSRSRILADARIYSKLTAWLRPREYTGIPAADAALARAFVATKLRLPADLAGALQELRRIQADLSLEDLRALRSTTGTAQLLAVSEPGRRAFSPGPPSSPGQEQAHPGSSGGESAALELSDEGLSLLELACGLCFTDAVCLILGMEQGSHHGADGSFSAALAPRLSGMLGEPGRPVSLVTPRALHLFVRSAVHTTARQSYLKTFALLLARADPSVLEAANEFGESLLREVTQLSVTSSFRRELIHELLQTGPELAVEGKLESWSAFEALVRTRDPGSLMLLLEHVSAVARGAPVSPVTLRVLGVSRAFALSVRLGALPCLLQFLNTDFSAELFSDTAPMSLALACRQYDTLKCLADFAAGRAAAADSGAEQAAWISQFSIVGEALCLGRVEEAEALLGRLEGLARVQGDQGLYSALVDLCTGADSHGLTLLTASLLSGSPALLQRSAGLLRGLGALQYSVLGCDLVALAHAAPGLPPAIVKATEDLQKEVCGQLPGQRRVTTTPDEYGVLLENYLAFLAQTFQGPGACSPPGPAAQRRDSRKGRASRGVHSSEMLNLSLLPSAPPGFSPGTDPLPCGRTLVEVAYAVLPPEAARAVFTRLGLLREQAGAAVGATEPREARETGVAVGAGDPRNGRQGRTHGGRGLQDLSSEPLGGSPDQPLDEPLASPRASPPPDIMTRLFVINATRRDSPDPVRQDWAQVLLDLGCDPAHEVMVNGRALNARRFM